MTTRNKDSGKPQSSRARNRRLARKQTNTLSFETLEPKHLLAAVTVGNATDLLNAPDTSSITALIANDGGDGISLREAITAANNTSGADAITFDESVFTGGDNNLIRLTQGELVINEGLSFDSLSIDGTSVDGVVITGDANDDDVTIGGTDITDVSASFGGVVGAADDFLDDNSRVINVYTPPQSLNFIDNVTLSGLTITGGRTSDRSGGGINVGVVQTLSLNQITISGNSTIGGGSNGGGISVGFANFSLTDSIVSGNSTTGNDSGGGGIYARGGSLSLSNSTISENSTTGDSSRGGGIYAGGGSLLLSNSFVSGNSTTGQSGHGGGVGTFSGDVSLINSTLSDNHASGYLSQGGGIAAGENSVYFAGVYTATDFNRIHLTNSTVSGNSTAGGFGRGGGGIRIGYGYLSLTNSLISGNSTSGVRGFGGGISSFGSTVSISNSTVSGNISTDGGGIHTDGTEITLTNSTVTGNTGSEYTGGILNFSFTTSNFPKSVTLLNSVVAGNVDSGSSPDFFTPADEVDDLTIENSLIGDTTGSNITSTTGSGNILNQPALLGALADNGGSTQTHALLPGSPAINAGDNALAAGLTTDQRGSGFVRIEAGTVDIGSFELQPIRTAGQFVFYNNSSFDSASDSAAIATDKVALRNGETATFDNYTSYIHGINGIAVDLFSSNGLVASDFQFSFGNGDDVDAYATLDSTSIITNLTTVAGAGVNGSDRVLIEFADGTITNGWLQVTVLANSSTELTDDDVFYFGNVIGESGNDPNNALVNLSDISNSRTNQTGFGATDVFNVYDFNRDAVVNLADISIARTNQSGFTSIDLITPTSSSGTPSNKLPPAAASIANASISIPAAVSTLELATTEASTLGLTAPLLSAITVSNATDISNAPDTSSITALMADDGGDGISLREAITAADNTFGEDTITFDGSVFTGGSNSVIRLTQGELEISDSVNVDGTFAAEVLITGDANGDDVTVRNTNITDVDLSDDASSLGDNSRVLNFSASTGNLTLTGLTITGGRTTGNDDGGGILFNSSDTLTLDQSTVSGNSTSSGLTQRSSGAGAGIFSPSGDVRLTNSTLSGNSGGDDGGGIYTRSGDITLTDSTLSGNSSREAGGGIYALSGTVTLTNSTVSGNTTFDNSGHGGGIHNRNGDITLNNSTLSDNRTLGYGADGGGIWTGDGDVTLNNSTLSGNSTEGGGNPTTSTYADGGGISTGGNLFLIDSTVSGNSTRSTGGGIRVPYSSANIVIVNSTVTGNSAQQGGGINLGNAFFPVSGLLLTLHNSIVSGNTASSGPDVQARSSNISSIENSLIGDTTGSYITAATGTGNILNQPALLAPLADNGGPTLTHALLTGSPAIDAGSNALAVDENGNPLATDQRGESRVNGTVDIGAVEDQTPQAIQTAGQFVFYNNSSFDSASDSAAIATDKVALRNGETATFENYTSYIDGINGIAVDLFSSNGLVASDLQFKFGNGDDVDAYATLDSASIITNLNTVAGAGVNGSDRVLIEFADGAITNGWLQVTVLANASTGLTDDDVFYFGNVVGESGNDPTNAIVNLSDISNARTNQTGFGSTDVLNVLDFNRDAVVNLADISIARTNQSGFTQINLITPTSSSASPSNKLPTATVTTASTSVSLPITDLTTELAMPNFSSLAAATTVQTYTTDQLERSDPTESLQQNRLALVGANLNKPSTQQNLLDQVFETTEQENDFADNIPLTDIDSLFETNFSADF